VAVLTVGTEEWRVMSTALAEHHATWARGIALLLGSGWNWTPEGVVSSDRVTIDLRTNTIEFRSNAEDGGTCGLIVNSGATLGTYAALARALHGLTDESARDELRALTVAARDAHNRLESWVSKHNKP
jgi:hypothetical protein